MRYRHMTEEELSVWRTDLANERTLLSYCRTSVTVIILGTGLVKLFETSNPIVIAGSVSIFMGIATLAFGISRYLNVRRRIRNKGGYRE